MIRSFFSFHCFTFHSFTFADSTLNQIRGLRSVLLPSNIAKPLGADKGFETFVYRLAQSDASIVEEDVLKQLRTIGYTQ